MDQKMVTKESVDKVRTEGNQCIAIGIGVGGLGTVAAVALGATCPLCFVAAPALIGMGVYRRITAKQRGSGKSDDTKRNDAH